MAKTPVNSVIICKMNMDEQGDISQKKPFLMKAINFLVDNLLFVALLALFITMFKKVFGSSEVANIIRFIISLPLASIFFNLIDKNFSGFIILFIFTLPAFALALVFLFT